MKDKNAKGRNDKSKMAVLTAECDRIFRVDKKQLYLFEKVERHKKNREKAEAIVSKISEKIFVEDNISSNDNP